MGGGLIKMAGSADKNGMFNFIFALHSTFCFASPPLSNCEFLNGLSPVVAENGNKQIGNEV